MTRYYIADNTEIVEGSAKELLQRILNKQSPYAEDLRKLTVDQYASQLIDSAPYYLEGAQLTLFKALSFATPYDRALGLLSIIPNSKTHILMAQSSEQEQAAAQSR